MRIKFDFEIPVPLIIIGVLVVLFVATSGIWVDLLGYLRSKDTILHMHGTLIAALIALTIGYTTINTMREQILQTERHKKEQQGMVAQAYLYECMTITSFVNICGNTILNSNNKHETTVFLHTLSRLAKETSPTDWQIHANIPPNSLHDFAELKSRITFLLQNISAISDTVEIPIDITKKIFLEIMQNADEIDDLIKKIANKHFD